MAGRPQAGVPLPFTSGHPVLLASPSYFWVRPLAELIAFQSLWDSPYFLDIQLVWSNSKALSSIQSLSAPPAGVFLRCKHLDMGTSHVGSSHPQHAASHPLPHRCLWSPQAAAWGGGQVAGDPAGSGVLRGFRCQEMALPH